MGGTGGVINCLAGDNGGAAATVLPQKHPEHSSIPEEGLSAHRSKWALLTAGLLVLGILRIRGRLSSHRGLP